MKKRIVAVTCVLMFCLGLIGCGTERADKTQQLIRGAAPGYNDGLIRVGMIQTGKESDWRDANTNDYLNTFTKERGYDLIYIDGNSSSERQVKAMYDLAESRLYYPAAHRGDRMGGCHTCRKGSWDTGHRSGS